MRPTNVASAQVDRGDPYGIRRGLILSFILYWIRRMTLVAMILMSSAAVEWVHAAEMKWTRSGAPLEGIQAWVGSIPGTFMPGEGDHVYVKFTNGTALTKRVFFSVLWDCAVGNGQLMNDEVLVPPAGRMGSEVVFHYRVCAAGSREGPPRDVAVAMVSIQSLDDEKKSARAYATLLVSVDMACELTVDDAKTPIAIPAGTPKRVPISKGDHLLRWKVPSANAMFYDWMSVEDRGTQEYERKFVYDVKCRQDGATKQEAAGTVVRGDLMWTVRDNGFDVNWYDAKAYCEACRVGGYSDWRMPTIDELEELYDETQSRKLDELYDESYSGDPDVHIAKPFRLTSSSQWSSTRDGSYRAFGIFFEFQGRGAESLIDRFFQRVLCVRRFGK